MKSVEWCYISGDINMLSVSHHSPFKVSKCKWYVIFIAYCYEEMSTHFSFIAVADTFIMTSVFYSYVWEGKLFSSPVDLKSDTIQCLCIYFLSIYLVRSFMDTIYLLTLIHYTEPPHTPLYTLVYITNDIILWTQRRHIWSIFSLAPLWE